MGKEKFLLVSLEDSQAKQLAEVLSNETSRKIMNYLSEKDDATETQLAKALNIPLSTVHYNLQNLKEARLVDPETFHYSEKGREVDHYKLANKYVIITPKGVKGIKTQLRQLLPVALTLAGMSVVLQIVQNMMSKSAMVAQTAYQQVVPVITPILSNVSDITQSFDQEGLDVISTLSTPSTAQYSAIKISPASQVAQTISTAEPNIALWFFLGGIAALAIYLIISRLRNK